MESKEGEIQPSHARALLGPRPYPWLVFIEEERQTFFDVSNQRYYKESIPEMCNKRVIDCTHGWFVLVDLTLDDCYLFNLISLEKIQLPPSGTEVIDYDFCILSSSPSDPTCHILLIKYCENSFLFCKLGDTEFTEQKIEDADNSKLMAAIVVGETIYCLIYRANSSGRLYMLCTILFTGSEVQFKNVVTEQLFLQEAPQISRFWPYLIEGCGEIFLVLKVFWGHDIDRTREFIVFAMDFSKKRWVKLASLGDRTIFLASHYGVICLAAESGVQPDSIYYTLLDDRHLYVLDFKNQTVSTSLPCPIVNRYSDLVWTMI